jgi:hypothetical protein
MPPSATTLRLVRLVYVVLGRPSQQKLPYKDVEALLGTASKEVIKAVASDPNNSYFSSLATLVTVSNGDMLPQYEGQPGVPLIVPYPGAEARSGIPADPDEIDSYRHDIVTGPGYKALYSGSVDAKAVAYNAQTKGGRVSPTACRYSIVNGQIKFTGDTCQIPLVQVDISNAAGAVDQVPSAYEPTTLRLAIGWLGQPWDKFYPICLRMALEARNDLAAIRAGARAVPPLSPTMMAQKAS